MKVAVTSVGGQQLSLNNVALPNGWKYFKPHQYIDIAKFSPDVLWLGGFPGQGYVEWQFHKCIIGEIPKVIVQWFGSDILASRGFYEKGQRAMFDWLNTDKFVHVSPSDEAEIEIETLLGIKTSGVVADVPAKKILERVPLPDVFSVGIYMPPHRMDFFNYGTICEAMKELDVMAHWYHWLPKLADIKPPGRHTVRYGQTDQEYMDTIAKSSCLLRIPYHDAISISVAEFLMSGRPVISNQNLPKYKKMIKGDVTPDKIIQAVKRVQRKLEVTDEVRDHYIGLYDPALYRKKLEEAARTKWGDFSFDS